MMSTRPNAFPLELGPLGIAPLGVRRSQPRWLVPDGSVVRVGQPLAFFNLSIAVHSGGGYLHPMPEERSLQLVLICPRDGRVRWDMRSDGGMRDTLGAFPWDEREVLGRLEPADPVGAEPRLEFLFLAGQRLGWMADANTALTPGWNSRVRAWWEKRPDEKMRTLLCIGLCEASTAVRGASGAFIEMFRLIPYSAHVSLMSEHPLVPCAPTLIDGLRLSPVHVEAIERDLAQAFYDGPRPTADDWVFAGAMMRQLTAAPFAQNSLCLMRRGLEKIEPPTRALLSLAAEPFRLLRHRKLGYRIYVLNHDLHACGPALKHWMRHQFEPVDRSVADVSDDYRTLIALVARATGGRLMIINRVSSAAYENVYSYAGFAPPLSRSLGYVAAKELNLALEDLRTAGELDIVDADAAAVELGVRKHAPDGIHFSETMNALLRPQIVSLLDASASTSSRRNDVASNETRLGRG